MKCAVTLAAAVALLAGAAVPVDAASASGAAQRSCPTTVAPRSANPDAGTGPGAFGYGGARLRVQLGWPRGTLAAGILPDGGSWATVEDDGSIHAKVGWWRGVAGRLRITGRRLDAPAPPLGAHVPRGYGTRGFQPSGLLFPTVGCWRVVGAVGDARLAFVVKVTRLPLG